jgi:hypothetical protein
MLSLGPSFVFAWDCSVPAVVVLFERPFSKVRISSGSCGRKCIPVCHLAVTGYLICRVIAGQHSSANHMFLCC